MFEFSISSFLLGIAFCAPPGVITAEAIRRGLKGGFLPAFLVEIGSLVGDSVWAILALAGGAILIQNTIARICLGLGGAFLLLYFAWSAFKDALGKKLPTTKETHNQGDFASGALLSLGNPFAITFWLTVGSTAIASRVIETQPIHYFIFFFSFMIGALLWSLLLAGLIAHGRKFVSPVFFRWVNLVCGSFLTYFALQLGWNSLLEILG